MSSSFEIADQAPLQEIVGYLNFSSGASDPAFLRRLDELWQVIQNAGTPPGKVCAVAQHLLAHKLKELAAGSPAFRNAEQGRQALRLIFDEVLPAYRRHHRDLLFHQSDVELWQPFFIGRVAEVVLAAGAPWNETETIVEQSLNRLNDFIGYRPVPVLETHKHEPYAHERVRPAPLYIVGTGVSGGKYHELIEQTLAILRNTPPDLLDAAGFDLAALDELAFDPRAYDFNHPVNRRPNYHFGTWDPHLIDNKGRYRRFVIQQCTLDAALARIQQSHDLPREQVLFEAGAVLAGTILMASGTTGNGPEAHDSSVSLATLLPKIARYRDEFYQHLLAQLQGEHRQRLEAEAAARRQPFAGARQHLNAELARLRALQLQHVRLALIFSRLGFSEAALRQSQIVPAASARMACQIQCLLTTGHHLADADRLQDAAAVLPQVEDLLQRAIACGAVIDPWNILGFGGQFSLFPAVENSIPDPRVDELFDLVEQLFALYARLWHEGATADDMTLQKRIAGAFRKAANWWDRFATTAVEGVRHIFGSEAVVASQRVADALAAWHKAGDSAGQVAFWLPYVEQFDSPQAYSRVIEVLLAQPDLQAAMALLMHWLSQAETVRLDEGAPSFYALAMRWLQIALAASTAAGAELQNDRSLALKFFDHLEANAEQFWVVPQWQSGEFPGSHPPSRTLETATGTSADDFDENDAGQKDEEHEDDLFSAAYENMVYRDSTADGTDADMLEVPGAGDTSNDELECELRRLAPRLAFLAMLAAQWKLVAWVLGSNQRLAQTESGGMLTPPDSGQKLESRKKEPIALKHASLAVPSEWLARAQKNRQQLLVLTADIQRYPLTISSASYDALLEYDRRRLTREMLLEKVIATLTATIEAEFSLAAVCSTAHGAEASASKAPATASPATAAQPVAKKETSDEKSDAFTPRPQTIAMISAIMAGNVQAVRAAWGTFLVEVARQPLLYVPLARGGDARKIAATRALQQTLREMLRRLPQLGLLRQTCQLLRVARVMEKEHSPGAGAVTEFDRLFEIGYQAIVESLVESSLGWNTEQRPTADSAAAADATADLQLIDCLQQVTEALLSEWLSHSRTLRLSALERVASEKAWQELVKFIERYGHDLFTQQFFQLGNLRAILYQGVDAWLQRLVQADETEESLLLVKELDHGLSRAEAKKHLSLVIEVIVENYAEYRDYNATTTQSDRGEMLYTLLDFLRVKVGYERIHWNLRPVIMAHEVLIRRGLNGPAELWRRIMAQRTTEVADQQLTRLAKLQTQYGMRLSTVADRLRERFVRPLVIDRVRALVQPAAEEARRGEQPTAFALLEQEAGDLADEPCGAGLDLPDWLEVLEEEADRVCQQPAGRDIEDESLIAAPRVRLTWDEIQLQLSDWDTPPEISR
ncbi:MAG TPA: hypothetical protein VMJ32_15490 [Pirellulales bacterium]|nr:hypothetical protein [Pirellulales bacterium]